MTTAPVHIYHITQAGAWLGARESGYYAAPSLATEGFIHCCTESQLAGVLDRYYRGVADLLRLTIDPEKLEAPLVFELSPSVNQAFPHVYGKLNINAIVSVDKI